MSPKFAYPHAQSVWIYAAEAHKHGRTYRQIADDIEARIGVALTRAQVQHAAEKGGYTPPRGIGAYAKEIERWVGLGWTDAKIAERIGWTVGGVRSWRLRNGIGKKAGYKLDGKPYRKSREHQLRREAEMAAGMGWPQARTKKQARVLQTGYDLGPEFHVNDLRDAIGWTGRQPGKMFRELCRAGLFDCSAKRGRYSLAVSPETPTELQARLLQRFADKEDLIAEAVSFSLANAYKFVGRDAVERRWDACCSRIAYGNGQRVFSISIYDAEGKVFADLAERSA